MNLVEQWAREFIDLIKVSGNAIETVHDEQCVNNGFKAGIEKFRAEVLEAVNSRLAFRSDTLSMELETLINSLGLGEVDGK